MPERDRPGGLLRVGNVEPPLTAVTEKLSKRGNIMRCGDDQQIPNLAQHQSGERVIHHRFVVYGEELLADRPGHRMKAGSGAAGQNDPFSSSGRGTLACHQLVLQWQRNPPPIPGGQVRGDENLQRVESFPPVRIRPGLAAE